MFFRNILNTTLLLLYLYYPLTFNNYNCMLSLSNSVSICITLDSLEAIFFLVILF